VKISPGCKHCYAETFAERFRGVPGHPYEQGFDVRLVPHKLADPLRWASSRMVFVNSMSDLFQTDVPESYIASVIEVMETANWHTYQVLTKRSERMREVISRVYSGRAVPDHIWFGVSVEDQKHGLPRIDDLRQTPAGIRFLSIEPLLEDLGEIDLGGIDWVIVGGESGQGSRPMRKEWVESILAQCQAAGVLFFFKQWGGVQKSRAGRLLNGRTYDELPDRKPGEAPQKQLRDSMAADLRLQINRILGSSGMDWRDADKVPA
jgi:protein gp37